MKPILKNGDELTSAVIDQLPLLNLEQNILKYYNLNMSNLSIEVSKAFDTMYLLRLLEKHRILVPEEKSKMLLTVTF